MGLNGFESRSSEYICIENIFKSERYSLVLRGSNAYYLILIANFGARKLKTEKMKYKDKIIKGIDNYTIDTDELKTDFNEYLYNKGYTFEQVTNYTDEHFENLLTFKQNERKFIKSLQE